MKIRQITALLLLAATMLIGCSCSDNGGGEPAPSGEVIKTEQAHSEADGAAATGEAISTQALPVSENRIYSPDDYCIDYRSFTVGEGGFTNMAEDEDTIFLLQKGFLYFTDKEYKDWMPLCPRPDCKHDSEDCGAYLGAVALQYRNGYIYYVDDCGWDIGDEEFHIHHPNLCRMRTDGTQHERLFEIPYPEFEDKDFNPMNDRWECFATNKYFVFKLVLFEYDEYGEPSFETHMFSVDMDTFKVTQLFTDLPERAKAASCFMLLEGRDRYIYGQENYSVKGGKNVIVEVDLESGESRELCTFEPYIRYLEKVSSISNKALYFIDYDMDASKKTLYRVDIDTCEVTIEKEASTKDSKWMIFDSYNGCYCGTGATNMEEGERGTYICDADFNVIEFLPYDEYPQEYFKAFEDYITACKIQHPELEYDENKHYPIYISYITKDYIFGMGPYIEMNTYEVMNENEEIETHYVISTRFNMQFIPMWYLDKKDIGTGNLQWKKWAP